MAGVSGRRRWPEKRRIGVVGELTGRGRRRVGLGWLGALVGQAAGAASLLGKQVLDLPVDAAELVPGPAAQGVVEARIEPEEESFGIGHREVADQV